jgi:3-demethoxyubiquinol 3-hydroxylase
MANLSKRFIRISLLYRKFSSSSPEIAKILQVAEIESKSIPNWLLLELKTNHAGEFGAVQIYRGAFYGLTLRKKLISADTYNDAFAFVQKHMNTEMEHLELMERILPETNRTALLPIWSVAGFLTGFLPAVFGKRALFHTVAAVETFVEEHYNQQISRLLMNEKDKFPHIRQVLEHCCLEEVSHKDEALLLLHTNVDDSANKSKPNIIARRSLLIDVWVLIVDKGSRLAVSMSRVL